jgi:hypothetical protein
MTRVSKHQLWSFLSESYEEDDGSGVALDDKLLAALGRCDLRPIVADFGMSEHHLGGDDLIGVVESVVQATRDGYEIVTWYGDHTQALVAGYRKEQLSVV